MEIEPGFCKCGCGGRTSVPRKSCASRGVVRGVPLDYVKGHNRRSSGSDYTVAEDGCWVWNLSTTRDGYGQAWCSEEKRTYKAHRLYYKRYVGEIPDGAHIDHICQNTRCVNPDHLQPISALENTRRSRHAKMTMEIARDIRSSPMAGVELAEKYGVSRSVISAIRLNRTWREANA